MKKVLSLLLLCMLTFSTARSQILSVGPMLHCYFPGGKPKITAGFEVAAYFLAPLSNIGLPSIDLGIEGGRDVTFVYSEFQLATIMREGITLYRNSSSVLGGSIGPFIKFEKEKPSEIGLQLTVWDCFIVGADLRLRAAPKYLDLGAGTFAKLPIPLLNMHF